VGRIGEREEFVQEERLELEGMGRVEGEERVVRIGGRDI
jgi:hypothetical protein